MSVVQVVEVVKTVKIVEAQIAGARMEEYTLSFSS